MARFAGSKTTNRKSAARYLSPLLLCTAWLVLASTGCSDPLKDKRGEVSGTVTLDGQPVAKGEIRFIPNGANSGPSTGGPITDGKYHIGYKTGPAVGSNEVQFDGTRLTGKKVTIKGSELDERVDVFPTKYQMVSPEQRDVKPGKNTFDFDLKSN